jgi:DNA-binding beta-propeller fold protein YncE
MYFVEMQNHVVRKVTRATGIITTIAGTGQMGFGGDGGLALKAQFNRPHSIALDHQGHLYVADIGNHRIRQIDLRQGTVRTIAGNGDRTLPRDGQLAAGTPVLGPRALFISGDAMWIALREGHSVWRLNLEQLVWNHIAGSGEQGYSGDGGQAKTATFNGPKGIAISPTGDILVVDTENHAIRRIDADGWTIQTVAGGGRGSSGDGGPATDALMDRPHGICVASDGTIFVGDTLNHRVRRVSP